MNSSVTNFQVAQKVKTYSVCHIATLANNFQDARGAKEGKQYFEMFIFRYWPKINTKFLNGFDVFWCFC